MAIKTYLVVANDAAFAQLGELADRLRAAGLHVTRQLDATGVVVGSADEAVLPTLQAVNGVAAIEEERTYQLPPSHDEDDDTQ